MVKLLKRYQWEILFFLLITALYFSLRLPNLTLQPIFADEAIYIRWAQVMRAEPTLRFLPLSDGKTPLFMWAMMPLFKIFADPLLAGRILSVLSGYLTLLGVGFLGWRVFNLRVGLLGAFLVVITPLMVFFDRMALVDSLLAAFSVWSLNLALLLAQKLRLDLAMILGFSLGGGILTKTPGMFSLLALPLTALIFDWSPKLRQTRLLKMVGLWAVAVTIGLVIYNALRLGPNFNNLSSRNQDYMFSPLDLVGRPLDPFLPHLGDINNWFPIFLTWPVLLFIFLGIALTFIFKNLPALVVLVWSLIPLAAEMALLKTFTARYILFTIPPLFVLAAWGVEYLRSRIPLKPFLSFSLLLVVLLLSPLYFSFQLLTNPAAVPLPQGERRGYLEDWTAGYGFSEIAQFLIQEAGKEGVVVGTEGYFGTLPDGLQIYLDKYSHEASEGKKISIVGGRAEVSDELRQAAKEHPTYFVANKSRFPQALENMELLREYPKAKGENRPQDAILLFKIFPLESSSFTPLP
ncbi:MAG: hypothetical protein UU73_C0001G0207 [Candidatus Daviesbacteria bacterium GW2011_GWA1_41_61]|uniref:Glycosyltransferase RgtA/B/C/D-like domain-containing protein n=1 Tax=Candidatus Daviesbacteria bacterium GW2011_GWA2_40_9 TaxID=1618424 RepID=A0A0G0WE67_9BACT|nr:MAG: hypothetical protein UU26_C0017G0003 [Candidatus Daviesbacteria bacterium GW2011_GWC1_40_9]KKR82575.1 MAG: hypothetical protein UU29_C0011G0022 [Candidatus Daviesbacteria bacterium GW2011_GWA2_40_9]KKR93026.1 MAG: hypothetical protein UU44_C0004G0208 [Candidatus Daviesbacteria bacterium GW2011_GWB1_41_15]KKS15570.1 MAG: hypothetical protein UU73_C0001G0207 [Candidatus Daviesbacteria bacterium GW2011_GWA1_41_61]